MENLISVFFSLSFYDSLIKFTVNFAIYFVLTFPGP